MSRLWLESLSVVTILFNSPWGNYVNTSLNTGFFVVKSRVKFACTSSPFFYTVFRSQEKVEPVIGRPLKYLLEIWEIRRSRRRDFTLITVCSIHTKYLWDYRPLYLFSKINKKKKCLISTETTEIFINGYLKYLWDIHRIDSRNLSLFFPMHLHYLRYYLSLRPRVCGDRFTEGFTCREKCDKV